MKALVKVEKAVLEFLKEEGYFFEAEVKNPNDLLSPLYAVKVLNKNRAVICGYDEEEGSYYVSNVVGSLEDGFEFDYNSYWYDSKEEALEYFNSVKK